MLLLVKITASNYFYFERKYLLIFDINNCGDNYNEAYLSHGVNTYINYIITNHFSFCLRRYFCISVCISYFQFIILYKTQIESFDKMKMQYISEKQL